MSQDLHNKLRSYFFRKSKQSITELPEEAPKPVTLINITTSSYAPMFMHVNHRDHFLLCVIGSYRHDQSLVMPAINFYMSPHLYFTCSFMRISRAFGLQFFLILNCRKWRISAIRDAALVVFFCDRDHVIVDRELQGTKMAALWGTWFSGGTGTVKPLAEECRLGEYNFSPLLMILL